eukprot:3936074-Rhodomonas_salina.2
MQIPEDWNTKHRCNAISQMPSNNNLHNIRGTKHIGSKDLNSFATEIANKHVNLNSKFIRSVGGDIESISSRILDMLPGTTQNEMTDENISNSPITPPKAKRHKKDGDSAKLETQDTQNDNANNIPNRCDMKLELDTLLSRLPYKRMMQDMLPCNSENAMPSVPYISRIYEESFMREPIKNTERQCVNGEECECMFIDKNNPFIATEFLVPGEDPPSNPQMCVLCSRAATQQLFYDIVFDNATFNGLIQRYGNLHSVPDEYSKEAMLICPPNGPIHSMPKPIMSHQRNRYSVKKVGGIKYINQHGVFFQ